MKFFCLVAVALLLAVGFQNCAPISASFLGSSPAPSQSSSGNGDGYSGKLTVYEQRDPSAPCAVKNALQVALPNAVILARSAQPTVLVRDKCQDITPVVLTPAQLLFEGFRVTYAGRVFVARTPATFETVVASCPAGRTMKSAPLRSNAFDDPINLAGPTWGTLEGMSAVLENAIAGLPAARVTRTRDATADPFLRLDQYQLMDANKNYSLSFLVKRGTASTLRLQVYDSGPPMTDATYIWDLTTGANTQSFNGNLQNVSTTSRAVEGGWFVTVHFRTPATFRGLDIGVAPATFAVGDSIFVSEAQLEETDAFCAP